MTDQNQPVPEPGMPECGDVKPRKSGFATASLVLGITGFITCGITAAFGLVLGILSLVQIGKDKSLIGQKMAVAGVVVSSIALIVAPIATIIGLVAYPNFIRAREQSRSRVCLSNVKQITAGVMMYSADHNDTLPDAKWVDSISPYLPDKKALRCPSVKSYQTCYAMNGKLSGMNRGKVKSPPDTVMIFDSIPGINLHGGRDLLPSPGRHYGGSGRFGDASIIGFADGHAAVTRDMDLASVKWDPTQE